MSRYRTVDVRMWGDAAFRSLSRPQPNAQSLWQYLLTGPHTGVLPGLFRAREAALADELGWSLESFRERFAELFTVRSRLGLEGVLAKADWEAGVVWIPNAINYNAPQNPNVVKHWADALDEIPECGLKAEAFLAFGAHCDARGKGFRDAFERLPKPSSNSFLNGSLNRMPNQDQDQEQELRECVAPDGALELALEQHSESLKPKAPRKPDEAKLALKSALAANIPVPPAISGGPMTKAAERLRGMLKAGKASSLGEAADMLVRAALASGKPFPWCLLDADPLRAPNRPTSSRDDLRPKLDRSSV